MRRNLKYETCTKEIEMKFITQGKEHAFIRIITFYKKKRKKRKRTNIRILETTPLYSIYNYEITKVES